MKIAQKRGLGPIRVVELIAANLNKKIILVNGVPTFKELFVGEILNIPKNWPCCAKCGSTGLGETPATDNPTNSYMPIYIGALALAAGVSLAYIVTKPPKSISQITEEEKRFS